MFIRKIKLEAFRSHVETTLDLAPLTFIRSPNGAGKSSIEQALELMLAGRCEGTSADGKGSAGLIRHGEAKAFVTAALIADPVDPNSERIVKMALNDTRRTCLVTKPSDPQYGAGADYLDFLALNRNVLSCLINNRYFVDLKEADQKDVLAGIILPKVYAWPDWVLPTVNDLGLKVKFTDTPFAVIECAYDAAFKARTDTNRDVKNFRMPEGDTTQAENYDDYKEQLDGRKRELDALKANKAKAEAEVRSRADLCKAAQTRIDEAKTRLARESQEVSVLEERLLRPANLKEAEKAAKGAARAAALDAEMARLSAEIAVTKKALEDLNAFSLQAECPTCRQAIGEDAVAAIAKPLMESRAALDTAYRAAGDERKALGNPAEAKAQVEAHTQAQKDMVRAKQRIKDEETAIEDARGKLDELRSSPEASAADLDAEIARLTSKVEDGTKAVGVAFLAKNILDQKVKATADRDALVKRQASLNNLCEYFGPEGVKADLLAASIGAFTDSMNESLGKWGFTCQLCIEPYRFAVMFMGGNDQPFFTDLKFLSKSQRYRFATAFQIALAQVSGFRFVVVDEADIYDSEGKAGLFEALTGGDLDQAIVFLTSEVQEAPDFEDTVFYYLEDIAEPGMVPTTKARRLIPAQAEAA